MFNKKNKSNLDTIKKLVTEEIKNKTVVEYYLTSDVKLDNFRISYTIYQPIIVGAHPKYPEQFLKTATIYGTTVQYISLESLNGISKLTRPMTAEDLFVEDKESTALQNLYEMSKELEDLRRLKESVKNIKKSFENA